MTSPAPKSPEVSERMRKVRTAGTKPELMLENEFRRRRYKVELNVSDLPGRPDLVLPNQQVAVFVHGCFWHGCPKHFTNPKHNRKWWKEKIANNKQRDLKKARQLRRLGWSVFNIWEHEEPVVVVNKIRASIARRNSRK